MAHWSQMAPPPQLPTAFAAAAQQRRGPSQVCVSCLTLNLNFNSYPKSNLI